ncbi:S6A17 protein, partial [Smithornis capensis]|nr:S6A17 protein [Smithornis capensis]
MPKNSKVTQREHSSEHVTESVADLLAHQEPVDYKRSVLNVTGEPWDKQKEGDEELDAERPAWNSKLQYILAQIGYSVGLGNVWRFPYLCQKNGGGAYLVPYLVLLVIIGLPLFFLELAVGQRIRRGSIGVWNYICPRLGGIGYASCLVCFFVGLYYNVIIGWSIFYFFKSFQFPLPWSECPLVKNGSVAVVETECERSSATTYFWYRETLDISNSISESGGLNWKMTLCLLVAWSLVGLAMIKGIQSSGKVSLDGPVPGAGISCLDHTLLGSRLEGSRKTGWRHVSCSSLGWGDRDNTSQGIWVSTGKPQGFVLGHGVISVPQFPTMWENRRTCVCWQTMEFPESFGLEKTLKPTHCTSQKLLPTQHSLESLFTELNAERILGYLNTNVLSHDLIPPHVNFSHLTAKDYNEMYRVIMTVKEGHFKELGLDPCLLEDELNKSVQGTGLAFIAFTEAMTHFPASPFWSVMFFLMLINLGLGSMIGTMSGITTPIIDTFKVRKEVFTVGCCIFAFLVGLIFVQRSGNYFVTMFDDYSATLPLTVVVILENIAVAWIYGTKKFMQELTEMLGFRPYQFYYYTWKYVSPICMAVLMTASIIQLGVSPPGYSAWIREEAAEKFLFYPTWAMAILISLILLASLPLPLVFILRQFHLVSDGSNALSVTYKKGRMMKDISNLEDNDETRFILSKVPSETPSPMPTHRSYLGPGSNSPLEMSAAPNGRYGSGYLLASTPESEL